MFDVRMYLERTVEKAMSRITNIHLLVVWVLFFSIWNVSSTGTPSLSAAVFFGALYLLCQKSGQLVLRKTLGLTTSDVALPLQLLTGYFFINTLLCLFILILPFGVVIDVFIMLALLVPIIIKQTDGMPEKKTPIPTQEVLAFLVGFLAASFWFQDALNPMRHESENIVFQLWPDSFFHARQISSLAFSHGWESISDIALAGVHPQLYHFAMYSIPSAFSAITEMKALYAFSSFLLPMGFVLTVFAAYSLLVRIFGRWPALAGCVALAVLPDAFQQGFGNKWLSYNWLQQIAPGGMYGVALMALAWVFMFDGCERGKARSVLAGYFLAALTITYKAHIFIANSYLIFVYPFLFVKKWKIWQKGVLVAFASLLYFGGVYVSQFSQSVPILRLNGSSFTSYIGGIVQGFERGPVGDLFMSTLTGQPSMTFMHVFWAVVMLSIATLGVFFPILVFVVARTTKRLPAYAWMFPIFVVAVYLVMSMGLEYDSRKVGTSEELLHRPFVWAYFIVGPWSVAGAAYLFMGKHRLSSKILVISCVLGLSLLPAFFAHEIQTMARWSATAEFTRVPQCLVDSADYIRNHSRRSDIIQDSGQGLLFDESSNRDGLIMTGLSERQVYVINSNGTRQAASAEARLRRLDELRLMDEEKEIVRTSSSYDIDWYILRPEDTVRWPDKFLSAPSYKCGGYRVFKF